MKPRLAAWLAALLVLSPSAMASEVTPAMHVVPGFDASRAKLSHPDQFPRFWVPDKGTPVAEARLAANDLLFVISFNGHHRGLLLKQLAYPHVAQGDLAGQPYVVDF